MPCSHGVSCLKAVPNGSSSLTESIRIQAGRTTLPLDQPLMDRFRCKEEQHRIQVGASSMLAQSQLLYSCSFLVNHPTRNKLAIKFRLTTSLFRRRKPTRRRKHYLPPRRRSTRCSVDSFW